MEKDNVNPPNKTVCIKKDDIPIFEKKPQKKSTPYKFKIDPEAKKDLDSIFWM